MNFTNRSGPELLAQSQRVYAAASAEADLHDLGCLAIVFTQDGTFRIASRGVNVTFAVGLLQRAALVMHEAQQAAPPAAEPPPTTTAEQPKVADGLLLWGSPADETKGRFW